MSDFRMFIWMCFITILLSIAMMTIGGIIGSEDLIGAGGGVFGVTAFIGVTVTAGREM